MIEKDRDLRLQGDNVGISQVDSTNRRYIEEELSHNAPLIRFTAEAFLTQAEVLVIANPGDDVRPIPPGCCTHRILIYLTLRSCL